MDTVKVLDHEETAEYQELDGKDDKLLEKKLLLAIGLVLTAASGVMAVVTSISLSRIQAVITFKESSHLYVGVPFIAFRAVTVTMILLAFMQLIANILLTAAVIKEKVSLLHRFAARYAIYNAVVGCIFWLLTLAICIYETQTLSDNGVWLALTVFIGGFMHAVLVLYFFMSVESQERASTEDTLSAEVEENASHYSYTKY